MAEKLSTAARIVLAAAGRGIRTIVLTVEGEEHRGDVVHIETTLAAHESVDPLCLEFAVEAILSSALAEIKEKVCECAVCAKQAARMTAALAALQEGTETAKGVMH